METLVEVVDMEVVLVEGEEVEDMVITMDTITMEAMVAAMVEVLAGMVVATGAMAGEAVAVMVTRVAAMEEEEEDTTTTTMEVVVVEATEVVTTELVVVVGAAVEVEVVVETTMTLEITTASRPPATAQ